MTVRVDDKDYEDLSQYKWLSLKCSDGYFYAARRENKKTILMHRYLLGLDFGDKHKGCFVNGNTLDCTRTNLRIVDNHLHGHFRIKHKNNTTGYRGVSYLSKKNKWKARIKSRNKTYYLGTFNTVIEAALAYDRGAIRLYGDNAYGYLNFSLKQEA